MLKKNKIVSAFLSNVNTNRLIDKYIELGKVLLNVETDKIIFLDEDVYELLKDYNNQFNTIIKINKNDVYLFCIKNEITDFHLNTDNPNKDTLEYVLTQCSKTEWIRKAIEYDTINNNVYDNYVWLDFGLRHIFSDDNIFINCVVNLNNKIYDKVRIGHIWNLDYKYNVNLLKNISWYFAGGVFGGNPNFLIIFADKMKEMCINHIKIFKSIPWEVNLWYLIYLGNKDLFNCYKCDHNITLLNNY
jgi:hypothetical protein